MPAMMPAENRMMSQDPAYLANLNPSQSEAVLAIDGPVLVLAGAGTGKTRVLTTRLAHILATHRAHPGEILAVTFTNKTANEMKERVSALLGDRPVEGWWIGTFHSIAARMLRRHAEMVGLSSNFTILDPDDQLRLVKQLIEVEGIDPQRWPARLILGVIDRWKDRALGPDQVSPQDAGDIANGKMQKIYAAYQERLKTLNACDFGDLLVHLVRIFRKPENRDVLESWQRRFKYILVDEYQDTNAAQYLWLRLLAQGSNNVCCVGDDDQSIYGWRGAEIGNILKFERDFPGAKVIRLEQNYRSTGHILATANRVIANNRGRLGKNLWSAAGEGEKLTLWSVWDAREEADKIAGEIVRLAGQGEKLGSMAILVRAGFQTREFEERFMREGIPYRVIGGLRFYERQEIRDALAYFRVIMQPADDLAFERIVNVPKRQIGEATLQPIKTVSRAKSISMTAATLALCETSELKPKARDTLRKLMDDFDRWRSMLSEVSHTEIARMVLDESGYTTMWQQEKTPEAQGRLENLKELVSAMAEFENMESFLEHVALVMENHDRSDQSSIAIMTLHGAKGLEFDTVFLPGWEEGLFPSQKTMDEAGLPGLEEERRLAYVGITRAKKRAFIFHAANRQIYGSWMSALPSRFISELPKENVEIKTSLYGHNPTAMEGMPAGVHRGRTAATIDAGDIPSVSTRQESELGFAPGSRVFHEKFGTGTVTAVDGSKLDITFDKSGRKKVMDSFVTMAGKDGAEKSGEA